MINTKHIISDARKYKDFLKNNPPKKIYYLVEDLLFYINKTIVLAVELDKERNKNKNKNQ